MNGTVTTLNGTVTTLEGTVATLNGNVTALQGTQAVVLEVVHNLQHELLDNISKRQTMFLSRCKFFQGSAQQQQHKEPTGTPWYVSNLLNTGYLECLNTGAVDLVFDKRVGYLLDRCNHAAHDYPSVAAQRDAIIRISDPTESLSMRLLFRYVHKCAVGTAAAALLSRSEPLQLAAGMSMTADQIALEVAAEKAEVMYFRRNIRLLRFLSQEERAQLR